MKSLHAAIGSASRSLTTIVDSIWHAISNILEIFDTKYNPILESSLSRLERYTIHKEKPGEMSKLDALTAQVEYKVVLFRGRFVHCERDETCDYA